MLRMQPIRIDTGTADTSGLLVFDNEYLVAVLVRLDDPAHEDIRGRWHFEALFNRLPPTTQTFADEADALEWIGQNHSSSSF